MNKKPVIAIDGTAASGKGTLAKQTAEIFGFAHLDTGKLYRYIGYAVLQAGEDPANKDAAIRAAERMKDDFMPEALQDVALTGDDAGQAASKVAAFPEVRAILLDYQRNFAKNPPQDAQGAVLDGRDIGTVVCPSADVKLYIDAKTEVRARRRHKELQSKGISVTYDAVLADMHERDSRDAGRQTSPMKPADDAVIIDTSDFSIDDTLNAALTAIRDKLDI